MTFTMFLTYTDINLHDMFLNRPGSRPITESFLFLICYAVLVTFPESGIQFLLRNAVPMFFYGKIVEILLVMPFILAFAVQLLQTPVRQTLLLIGILFYRRKTFCLQEHRDALIFVETYLLRFREVIHLRQRTHKYIIRSIIRFPCPEWRFPLKWNYGFLYSGTAASNFRICGEKLSGILKPKSSFKLSSRILIKSLLMPRSKAGKCRTINVFSPF